MGCSITLQTSKLFTDGTATKIAAVTSEASTDTATLDPTPALYSGGLPTRQKSPRGIRMWQATS